MPSIDDLNRLEERMSLQAAKDFLTQLRSSQAFQKHVQESSTDTLVALGHDNGFVFTAAELKRAHDDEGAEYHHCDDYMIL